MFFKPSFLIATLPLLFSSLSQAAPSSSRSNPDCDEKIGYLWTSFPVDDEAIYMHLSNNNDPLKNWTALSLDGTKDTQAILRSNIGNKGARDSFIQPSQDGSKYWLTATDLNVQSFGSNFIDATRYGSLSIVIWDSPDLAEWSEPRLSPPLVNSTAGNVWAIEFNWEPLTKTYVGIFASRFWDVEEDPGRNGTAPDNVLMQVQTNDFETFTEAQDYLTPGYPVIDATFLSYPEAGENAWIRWVKDERDFTIFQEISTNGILGDWSRVSNAPQSERITANSAYHNNEGPLCFRDNVDQGLFHLWIDENTQERYIPYSARTVEDMQAWKQESLDGFPENVKHGKVLAINQKQYDAISSKYKAVEN